MRLENQFGFSEYSSFPTHWDHDHARLLIAQMIPLSQAEAEEMFDEQLKQAEREAEAFGPKPETPIGRLRRILHANGLSLKYVLEAACDRIEGASDINGDNDGKTSEG